MNASFLSSTGKVNSVASVELGFQRVGFDSVNRMGLWQYVGYLQIKAEDNFWMTKLRQFNAKEHSLKNKD